MNSFRTAFSPVNRMLAAVAIFALVLSLAYGAFDMVSADQPENAGGGGGDFDIQCEVVSIVGDVWTMEGTWEAFDFPGQDNQYSVGIFSPDDQTEVDADTTFNITQGPSKYTGDASKDDMQGTWSSVVEFASTPDAVFAVLYHTQGAGQEKSGVCNVELPACSDTIDNEDTPDGLVDFPADPGCEDADDNNEFNAAPASQIDLSMSKEVNDSTPVEGGQVTYTLTVTNNGPDAATNIVITDDLPEGVTFVSSSVEADSTDPYTWEIASLASGADAAVTVTVDVGVEEGANTISNSASVTATETDTVPGNNSDSVDIIVEDLPSDAVLGCIAENANNRDLEANTDDGSCTYDLTVKKVIVGTTEDTADDFSFTVNDGSPVAFELDGTNTLSVAAGTYNVVETTATGYDTSYDTANCTDVVIAGPVTCTITNTVVEDEGNGGGQEEDTYEIKGFVWNDSDRDGTADEGEDGLEGFVVRASNGEVEFTDTTDSTGHYVITVPAGTWTVTQNSHSGWKLVEGDTSYEIVAPTPDEPESFTAMIMNALVPTAYAAVQETFDGNDFANRKVSGGGGGSSSSSNSNDDDEPAGEVLGESTTVLPVGAPNTGAGGTSSSPVASLISILGMLMSLVTIRFAKIG